MIYGTVNDRREATIDIEIIGATSRLNLAVVIDTGFNGTLSLDPNVVRELKLKSRGLREGGGLQCR